ncbi:carbohydrate binding family 6 [Ophiostoma piceae UAMH 11346]|uniref:Carbohydrate binding family 6 n=1 Tax=Ophiostoma piceae (strain UAMH 11346) TaxID=1262450 RepID=S3BSZ5_OPHP1|nr:carbohydrate binding family 6 [Ophiostoma piceae UAMH 11346]EPE03572.1 carbohydrate binding family 6 [Ophiostoma piceae UAMH 11346]
MVSSFLSQALLLAAVAFDCASAFPAHYRHVAPRATSVGVVGNIRIPTGYTTTLFSDGFAGTVGSLPSTDRWTIDVGTQYTGGAAKWGTGETQTYAKSTSNLKITAAGTLLITPVKTTTNGKTTWTSGRIENIKTWDFTAAVGKKLRIESRLKLGGANAASKQLGIWMAFWSLGSAYRGNYQNWPAIGEIDIMESLNGAARAYETVHCGTSSGGPCLETTGISTSNTMYRSVWYTVAVVVDRTASKTASDWKGESITWLMNEKVLFTVKATTVNNQAAWKALAQTAKFLLLNVAVGGSFPDAVAGVTTPTSATLGGEGSSLEVDYVAVFTS